MKKLFSLLALTLAMWGGANAQTYPDDYYVDLESKTTSESTNTENFFTITAINNYNTKYAATAFGKAFSAAGKIENSSSIEFTTTDAKSSVTIVQSTTSNGTLGNVKFDDTKLSYDNCSCTTYDDQGTDFKNVNVIKISNVEPGKHTITRSGEWGCLYVGVTYNKVSTATPTITTDLLDEYTTSVGTAATLSIVASDATIYQWYKATTQDGEGEAVQNATAETFNYVPTLDEVGEVYVYCIATNENATGDKTVKSKVAKVTVKPAYTATFTKEEEVIGTVPAAILTSADCQITIPANNTLFVEGKTLSSWKDESNTTYEIGETYTLTSNVTLSPVFTENNKSLNDIAEDKKVSFISSNSYQAQYQSANKNVFVEHITIDGETIDLGLIIEGGKFDMQTSYPRAQTNSGTKISIPVTKGAKVVIDIDDQKHHTFLCTINGENFESYLDGQSTDNRRKMTYTYDGNDSYIDYVVNQTDIYTYAIDVTYPKTKTFIEVGETGYRTFTSSSALNFTDGVDGLTAYRAVVKDGAVEFIEIDGEVPAKEGMLIKAAPGTHYVPLASGTPAAIENAFEGVTTAEDKDAGIYVLLNDKEKGLGFYKTTTTFTVSKNTAYLPSSVSNARSISLPGEGDDDTTGIIVVEGEKAADGKYFDLQGRQVSNPTNGLYIYNGKKYMVK